MTERKAFEVAETRSCEAVASAAAVDSFDRMTQVTTEASYTDSYIACRPVASRFALRTVEPTFDCSRLLAFHQPRKRHSENYWECSSRLVAAAAVVAPGWSSLSSPTQLTCASVAIHWCSYLVSCFEWCC